MKTKIYGAYGSNINLEQMAYRCPHAEVYKVGYINGYRLTFRSGGFANIEKSEGDRVPERPLLVLPPRRAAGGDSEGGGAPQRILYPH